eukprot:260664-Pyramimonas_sp.AAC.1
MTWPILSFCAARDRPRSNSELEAFGDTGSKHDFKHRLSHDMVSVASKKFTPLERGALRAAAGEAIWTRDFARSKGYQFPEGCEKCEGPSDSLST